jgi:hypothetical protein
MINSPTLLPTCDDRRPRVRRIVVGAGLLLLGAALAAAPDSPLDAVQKSAGEWVKLRAETARLESQWASQKTLLESTVKSLEERARLLEDKRENVKLRTAKDREELETMRAKNQATAVEIAAAEQRLTALSARLVELRPQLPPRLSSALEMSYRSLVATPLAAGDRMRLVTTILNRCAQFNQTVTCGEEVLTLESGAAPKLYPVIYWGLAQGYALDPAARRAWVGAPTPQGWNWTPRPDAAEPVRQLIAIYQGKSDPDFVGLPARLSHLLPAPTK